MKGIQGSFIWGVVGVLVGALLVLGWQNFTGEQVQHIVPVINPQSIMAKGFFPELRAERMALGKRYRVADTVCWEKDKCAQYSEKQSDAGLLVEGSVGVGIVNPKEKLDVAGQIHASEDVCIDRRNGRCLSDGMAIGGFFFTRYGKNGCMAPNPLTGTCSCPAGYRANGYHYIESSKKFVYWVCWR